MNLFFHAWLSFAILFSFAVSGHQDSIRGHHLIPTQAQNIIDDIKNEDKEIDEGDEKDAVFINPKLKQEWKKEKNFEGLKKILTLKTQMGSALLDNRIQNPIKNKVVLDKRQAIISFFANNPELLDKLHTLIATITPEVEETLLQLAAEQELHEKRLYCATPYIPITIKRIINNNRALLALWQVVPHCVGAAITLFDPALHWLSFNGCHSHHHGHKKNSQSLISKFKQGASYISLAKTTFEAMLGILDYSTLIVQQYKELFKKAKALKTATAATQRVNALLGNHSTTQILIKKNEIERELYPLVQTINGASNIGSLPRLQYLLSDQQTTSHVKKLLYHLGKIDLYISIAKALEKNKLTLCQYAQNSSPILMLKNGISAQKDNQPIPNTFVYHQAPTIITGPGGSGKSEYLKMITDTVTLAQSLGVITQAGNSECVITPLDYIISHSNITDHRGVASTSQTETARLKEYNNLLQSNPNAKGIILFDELLKHSNPESASTALVALVTFFSQYPQLIALYSTHFKAVSEIKTAQQLSTTIIQTKDGDIPTYEIVQGANNSCNIIQQLSAALGKGFAVLCKNS